MSRRPYRNVFTPDCLPTEAIRLADSGLRQAVPSREDLARAESDHGRLVHAYELVCGLLAEARMHLLRGLPTNWREDEVHRDAVRFLDVQLRGWAEIDRQRQDPTHEGSKLP